MSNRLSIEIANTQWRSQENHFQSIDIFDDEDSVSILHEMKIPTDPAEVLKLVCSLELQGSGQKLVELLDYHIVNASQEDGLSIEGDWIELIDPRISEIVEAYRDNNWEFFGLKSDDDDDSKEIESANDLSVGDYVKINSVRKIKS